MSAHVAHIAPFYLSYQDGFYASVTINSNYNSRILEVGFQGDSHVASFRVQNAEIVSALSKGDDRDTAHESNCVIFGAGYQLWRRCYGEVTEYSLLQVGEYGLFTTLKVFRLNSTAPSEPFGATGATFGAPSEPFEVTTEPPTIPSAFSTPTREVREVPEAPRAPPRPRRVLIDLTLDTDEEDEENFQVRINLPRRSHAHAPHSLPSQEELRRIRERQAQVQLDEEDSRAVGREYEVAHLHDYVELPPNDGENEPLAFSSEAIGQEEQRLLKKILFYAFGDSELFESWDDLLDKETGATEDELFKVCGYIAHIRSIIPAFQIIFRRSEFITKMFLDLALGADNDLVAMVCAQYNLPRFPNKNSAVNYYLENGSRKCAERCEREFGIYSKHVTPTVPSQIME